MDELAIHRVTRLDLTVRPWRWPFAAERHDEIDAHFAALRVKMPALWNGRILLGRGPVFEDVCFRADYFETDFANFIAWRDWRFPDASVFNGFGMGALRGNDGVFVLGEMAAHTANAGRIYFPCGTPDPADIRNGKVDLDHSIRRELLEETGLDVAELEADPGWIVVEEQARLVAYRTMRAQESGEALRQKVEGYLARQDDSELAAVRLVRNATDLVPAMPDYVQVFLRHVWR